MKAQNSWPGDRAINFLSLSASVLYKMILLIMFLRYTLIEIFDTLHNSCFCESPKHLSVFWLEVQEVFLVLAL